LTFLYFKSILEYTLKTEELAVKINNKRKMVELLESGALGNATRIWRTPEDLLLSTFQGPVAIRSLNSWKKYKPGMSTSDCIAYYYELIKSGDRASSLFFHEWTPEDSLECICHLARTEDGYELIWSYTSNIAIDSYCLQGVKAVEKTKDLVGGHNWDKLQQIFDNYPESVIEFSIHNSGQGICNEDMVVWEVRNY
jgi:hypothetical protein